MAGAGRFPVFSSESLFKVGKRLCGKAHIVHKRKPPLSGGVVGGGAARERPKPHNLYPLFFVIMTHSKRSELEVDSSMVLWGLSLLLLLLLLLAGLEST